MVDRTVTGSLLFAPPGGSTGAIVFDLGSPRKISADAPRCRLGDLLVEFGWLDAYAAESTYATALEQRELHGKVLVDHRLVDDAGLAHVLEHQLIRKLNWVATLPPETALGLREGVDLLATTPRNPRRASPLALLWMIAKCHVDERNRRAVLLRAQNRQLWLHSRSEPELFGFNSAEMALVDRLRHVRLDLVSLFSGLDLPRDVAETLVYLLLLTRNIDSCDGHLPVGVSDTPKVAVGISGEYSTGSARGVKSEPVPADPDAPDAPLRLRRELRQHAALANSADYYELLGVPADASVTAIRTAFTQLARRFHPDRLPGDLADLRPIAAQLISRWTTAYRTLTDQEQRAQYNRRREVNMNAVREGESRERQTSRALCSDALRKAEQLLLRDRVLLAEAEAKRALELEPDNPRCIAMHAWILSLLPNSAGALDVVLESLTRALDFDPMNIQARFYRSKILERMDRLEEAVGEWRLIIELDPHHIDAERELRLWQMRRASSRPPRRNASGTQRQVSLNPPEPGLFGRWFRNSR